MTLPAMKEVTYSFQDYQTWPDGIKCEILDGVIYDMSPAPCVKHQDIAGNFFFALKAHPNNSCHTGIAPTDVVFDEHNVVQPDVFLICDRSIITEMNIQGAPDLIIEIASPSTELKDRREKKKLYERFGVREYIIVSPDAEYVERYRLVSGEYEKPEIYNWDETFTLTVVEIEIDLCEIFGKREKMEEEMEEKIE